MKSIYHLQIRILLVALFFTLTVSAQTNPDFVLHSNGVTCLCPNADIGDVGTLTINGVDKTFTKRTRADLVTLIENDINDPQIALSCTSDITDMSSMFSFFVVNPASFNQNLSHWDVSSVTTMLSMFAGASTFNQPLNNWDVSNVTSMFQMFGAASLFNQPLNNWDVSNVENMLNMFLGATSFNQDISNWDVSNVENMQSMFSGFSGVVSSFNQPLNNWDVSNVTNMVNMFNGSSFNQDISNWDVSNVENMSSMFRASAFNQDISNWDVSNVANMGFMFLDSSFNQDISNWSFNEDVSLNFFLDNSGLDITNYDALLQSFHNQNLTDKTLGAFNVAYCDEQTRDNLINTKNWIIEGDVLGQCGQTFNPSTTPFVTTWDVQSDLTIDIFTVHFYDYNYSVDWGDGQIDQNVTSDISHTYATPGTYTVSITGVFPYFKTCENPVTTLNCTNAGKLSSVEAWGNQEWRYMMGSFSEAENFVINTTQVPVLTNVESMRFMFSNATNFNQTINNWDVSNVSDMGNMFAGASSFNQSLSSWDVSNVLAMDNMFDGASNFNQSINNWDVSNITNMFRMFSGASSFNQPLNEWDVSNVTVMSGMFDRASSFNQPLNDWDVSNVLNMGNMFSEAFNFNQPLNDWDVGNVRNMQNTFFGAINFNQPLNNWDVSEVTFMSRMFLSALVFNQDLSGWCVEQIEQEPFQFSLNAALQTSFMPDWGAECETFSIHEENFASLKVYPNPVKDQLNLIWPDASVGEEIEISIFSITGKIMYNQRFINFPNSLDVSPLSSGVYMLKLNSGEQSTVKRIIKK